MNVIVVDDERLARRELKSLLNSYTEINIVGEASNHIEAKELLDKFSVDLMFLDIQMPEKTGFELLQDLDKAPQVIFVTAYDEYAVKAFEVNALDYLLKPVEEERLDDCLNRLLETEGVRKEKNEFESDERGLLSIEDQIFIKDGEKCWFVTLDKVRMFESEGNYVKVFFDKKKPLILKSLNKLEEKLDPKYFFRANRKFIINLNWIEKVETWFNGGLQVTLKSGEIVEISRRQSVKFKDKLSL